ncbi:hypothetical protein EST38_g2944 [Candolleomyces aberdarensis]|uniref:Nudix hydrolase domain-containing protein n=1 Tax=Candolleomyces aberdarensis TaxID=2316362 RepID=A0A4Q2DR71_9AGAR|nr:hypothetical protein EST38_g2944 [Candolleomyces aberdarensis]
MSQDNAAAVVPLLSRALHRVRKTPPRIIASPPTQPRRAAVALIIRVVPSPHSPLPKTPSVPPTLAEFFRLDWVNDSHARAEILFLQRDNPANSGDAPFNQARVRASKEAHVAFPGGRMEPDDEGGLYTAMRQTWEEIGVDLAEKDYICVGQLDDREITTSLGKRLLMILSPFVFLQVTPNAPPADPIQSTTLCWTPLDSLIFPHSKSAWSTVTVDAASRLTPKNSAVLRLVVRLLVGSMQFPAIVIQPTSPSSLSPSNSKTSRQDIAEKGNNSNYGQLPPPQLKLWGLSLGMTLDLMSYMIIPTGDNDNNTQNDEKRSSRRGGTSTPSTPLSEVMQLPWQESVEDFRMEYVAPSLASVFPRFSYPDVNFWICTFYAAIRKALIVVIAARALGILFGFGFAAWWIFGQ